MSDLSRLQPPRRRIRIGEAGFTLVEMMIVTAVIAVVTGIAVVQIGASRQGLIGDGAMRIVLSQMNQAKELAITQRRNMRLTFLNANTVQIDREEVPGPALTTISTALFEGGLQFLKIATLPDLSTQTTEPASVPSLTMSATGAVAFGASTIQMRFAPDGTLIDQDGQMLNGTVFVARTNQLMSARAVAVFGSTGRIRGYRWDGAHWKVI
jgi:prepilin-type N-terminal cleavage/methylation domain-containing protein